MSVGLPKSLNRLLLPQQQTNLLGLILAQPLKMNKPFTVPALIRFYICIIIFILYCLNIGVKMYPYFTHTTSDLLQKQFLYSLVLINYYNYNKWLCYNKWQSCGEKVPLKVTQTTFFVQSNETRKPQNNYFILIRGQICRGGCWVS